MCRIFQALIFILFSCFCFAAETDWDVTQPRGKTRVLDFTTDEGTRMSVDLSPDGAWIVFDLLAHIYRVPAAGGKAECLTQNSGISINHGPRISPDGKSIAFISDRKGQENLWIMDADGTNPRPVFTDDEVCAVEPAWTPDSRYLIVRHQRSCHRGYGESEGLWMYHRDGGKGIRILKEAGASWPSVSPDGKMVYYQSLKCTRAPVSQADTLKGCQQIQRLVLADGSVEPVTHGVANFQQRLSSGGGLTPEISPDGRFLAFARRLPEGTVSFRGHKFGPRTALWIRDLNAGTERIVVDPLEIDLAEQPQFGVRVLPGYTWARDGKSLVFAQGGKLRRVQVESGKIETIPFEARVLRTISEMAAAKFRITDEPFKANFLRWHSASPDESRIVFQAAGKVWIQDRGAAPRRLTDTPANTFEYSPAWSPDGAWIAYTTWNDRNGGQLWRISSSGGNPVQLTREAGEYLNPSWSPDGKRIVLARGAGESFRNRGWFNNGWYEIVVLPVEGGAPDVVTRLVQPEYSYRVPRPSFGPEGRIFLLDLKLSEPEEGSEVENESTFISLRADGSDRKMHLKFKNATDVVPSPDGAHVAFVEGEELFVAPLPWNGAGSQPPKVERQNGFLPVQRVSSKGAMYPRWRDNSSLEFGSASKYFVYNIATKKMDTTDLVLTVPQNLPGGTLALTNAKLITLDGGKVIDGGSLVVKGSRIVCVGTCDPAGADRVIDLSGKTIIPGMIDMHAHHHEAHSGVIPHQDYQQAAYLAYGITTTLDPSAYSENVFSAAELIRAGLVAGPRAFSTAEAIDATDGQGDWLYSNDLENDETAEREILRRASWGAVSLKSYMQLRRIQRQWITEIARKNGIRVTGESGSLEFTLSLVMDGQTGWEHDILAPPLYKDVLQFVGRAGATYSPTFNVSTPGPWNEEYWFQESEVWKDEKLRRFNPWQGLAPHSRRHVRRPETDYGFALFAEGLAGIIAAGGNGALGGHGQQHGICTHWELWMAASAMPPEKALEVASLRGARFLGAEQDLGSLTPGKLADLIVLNSNPLDEIRNTTDILYVMKGGVLYDDETLNELWPEQREYGAPPWLQQDAWRSDDRPAHYHD